MVKDFWLIGFSFCVVVLAGMARNMALSSCNTVKEYYVEGRFPTAGQFANELLCNVRNKPIVLPGNSGYYNVLRNIIRLSDVDGRSLGALWEAAHEVAHVYQVRSGLWAIWSVIGWSLAVGSVVIWKILSYYYFSSWLAVLLVITAIAVLGVSEVNATKEAQNILLSKLTLTDEQKDDVRFYSRTMYFACFDFSSAYVFGLVTLAFMFLWQFGGMMLAKH